MVTHVVTGQFVSEVDFATPFSIIGNNLVLTRSGLIVTTGVSSNAIVGSNSTIRIHGEVYSTGGTAIVIAGGNLGNSIDISEYGYVESPFSAISSNASLVRVMNNGVLKGGNTGLSLEGEGNTVVNFGEIYSVGLGNAAIRVGEGTTGFANRVSNHGLVFGAFQGDLDNDIVVNTGVWHGGIFLGGNSDSFDSRRGELFDGGVSGGDGNDFIDGSQGDDPLSGDAGADSIRGVKGEDTITGDDGNDTLVGGADEDSIFAGSGNDLLIGGRDGDTLDGGAGFDVASYEKAAGAVTVYLLAPYLNSGEAAGDIYIGVEALTGSKFSDRLTGNSASNHIVGGLGADTMAGGFGNDSYSVENVGDQVIETVNAGIDTVNSLLAHTLSANVEHLTLQGGSLINGVGNSLDNFITGNASANSLNGLAGNDTLNGGGGNDAMTGSSGSDTFVFNTLANSASNSDRITDFNPAADTIQIENSVFGGLPTPGFLAASAFQIGAAANDSADRIIYNSSTGGLFHDVDGNGAAVAVKFAQLATGLALTNFDFIVV